MKILHVITSLRTGGAERLLVDLLPRLRDRGHNVGVLLFDGTCTPFVRQLESAGVAVHSIGLGRKAMHNPWLIFRLRDFLKHHDYDVIHTHNTPCQLLVAAVAGRSTLVTTEHNTTNRRRSWRWYRAVDRWMYGKYRRIICVSDATRLNLETTLRDKDIAGRMTVISNGIDISLFAKARPNEMLRKRYAGYHLVVMVAAFRQQKDQPTVIRAMASLPDTYRLLLVGDGERRAECETLVASLGLANKVSFAGVRADVPAILATADVVVLSSAYEGLALSSLEALASGRPFIASDVDGLRDIAGEAGLLFPLHDHERLTALIRRCCEDKSFAASVAQRGRDCSLRYDIGRMVGGYERLYSEIVKN